MAKRRRQYIVDRSFQLKYTLFTALVGGIISMIFGKWMLEAHRENTELLKLNEAFQMDSALKNAVDAADHQLVWIYFGITLLMMVALGLLGVLVTHRVAGPAYIMGRYLSVIADGAYPSLRPLRRKDELKGFFDALERAVEGLRERDKNEADCLDGAMETLAASGADQGAIAAIQSVVARKRASIAGATTLEDADESTEKA